MTHLNHPLPSPAIPTPVDPAFAERVRADFARQSVMALIGARLNRVAPGEVEIELAFRADLCQQHGFLHAGIVTSIVDSACGYAAFTLMPADAQVLTVELKANYLAPAAGERFIARGHVVRAGRTLTVTSGDVLAIRGEAAKAVCLVQATMMSAQPAVA